MELLILLLVFIGVAITAVALREDKIFKGYNPEAVDGDGDGLVQEGTKWERPIKSAPKKKAVAKKAAPAKKKAAKKKAAKKK